MKISQASSQFIQPSTHQNGDALVNSLMRAKENLSSQMQKLNQDKGIDEKTKQAKLKQLQTQMEELEQQLQKRQMEKLVEDSTKAITESSSSSSDSYKTAEERKQDAGVAMGKSLISASVSKGHLEHLGAMRTRLIAEDGGISERVKRTERMMATETVEINKSIDENQKAVQEYAQSSKEVEENRQSERDVKNQNDNNNIENVEEITTTDTNEQVNPEQADTTDSKAENIEQKHNGSRKEIKVREPELQLTTKSGKTAKAKFVPKEPEINIDISV